MIVIYFPRIYNRFIYFLDSDLEQSVAMQKGHNIPPWNIMPSLFLFGFAAAGMRQTARVFSFVSSKIRDQYSSVSMYFM